MSLWEDVRQTLSNTARSTKAIAVDSLETFHHHQALSLNKKADTIRQVDSDVEGSEGAVGYFKQKASVAANVRQQIAAQRQSDDDRFSRDNRIVEIYNAVTSDLETLKEASGVLWGYLKTADSLARATVKDTQQDIQAALESVDGKILKRVVQDNVQAVVEPVQQVWQQGSDNLRSLDIDRKGKEMLDYLQDLGRDRS